MVSSFSFPSPNIDRMFCSTVDLEIDVDVVLGRNIKMVNPPGWMLTSVAAYPVLKNWVNPRLLTDPLHTRVSEVTRLTAFIIYLSASSCQAKEWIRGRSSSQSFAERRMNRSAASPESRESIDFFGSSLFRDLRVLSVMDFTFSMSALDSLSGVSVCLAFGSTFDADVLELCFPWKILRMTCCPLAFICDDLGGSNRLTFDPIPFDRAHMKTTSPWHPLAISVTVKVWSVLGDGDFPISSLLLFVESSALFSRQMFLRDSMILIPASVARISLFPSRI
jgi:hypothetical protein